MLTYLQQARSRVRGDRGAVLVLVAAAIFPIIGIMTFAIDVSHWFDYSRNLQNRADAAALAGATQFGGTCFPGGNPGNVTNGAQASIGQFAQLYSGLSAGEAAANRFYSDAAVSALTVNGAPWNVTNNGYLNNTSPGSPITSPLTLRAGLANINNYWLSLNGNDYAPTAGGANTNFSMGAGGAGATFCSSDPTYDTTDPQCFGQAHGQTTGACAVGPMVDVKLTQKNIPLFVPIFPGLNPTIHAHSRVTLQGEQSTPVTPIAVGDTAFTPCISVNVVDQSSNTIIQNVQLPNRTQVQSTDPVQWSSNPTTITMPNTASVYLQPVLSDCNNTTQVYDDGTNSGLLMVNNAPSSAPTVANGNPPQLSTGGVTVNGTCPNATQYFAQSGADCQVEVDANVIFAPNVGNNATLTLNQRQWDNVNQVWNTTPNQMHPSQGNGANKCQNPAAYCTTVTIGDSSGIDQFSLSWSQTAGSIGATQCGTGNGQQPPPCTGQIRNGAILQQVFGACDACDQPDDSGPIIFARVSQNGNNDVNVMSPGQQSNVVFTLKLAGLNTAVYLGVNKPPPTVLRFSVTSNHTTGLVDCGQGNGANADAQAIYAGCGPNNPNFNPPLPELVVNTRNSCNPAPSASPWDCVRTTSGQRRQKIVCAIVLRVVKAPFSPNCNDANAGTCPTNNWDSSQGHPPANDPRAITMILTADVDLAAAGGAPNFWLPIYQFATFYVVGWDSKEKPQCPDNAAYPVKGKKNQQNGALWGYWINYTDVSGTPNGQPCPVNSQQPVNCVPALTR